MIEFEMDQVINHETGVQPLINGVQSSVWVIPMLDRSASLTSGDLIDHVGPYAIAAQVDVDALDLVFGNDGDTLTIGGIDYTVLAIDPDGLGGVVLSLQEVA